MGNRQYATAGLILSVAYCQLQIDSEILLQVKFMFFQQFTVFI